MRVVPPSRSVPVGICLSGVFYWAIALLFDVYGCGHSSILIRMLRLSGGVSLCFAKYRWLCLQARTSLDKSRI